MAKLSGDLGDLLQRFGLLERGHRAGQEGNAQHHHRGKEEDGGKGPPQFGEAGGLRRHIGHTHHGLDHLAAAAVQCLHHNGRTGHIALFREEPAQGAHTGISPRLGHLLHYGAGQIASAQGVVALNRYAVGGYHHLAIRLRDEYHGVGDLGDGGDHGNVDVILHTQPQSPGLGREVGHIIGVALHGFFGLTDGVLIGQSKERHTQQSKGHQDHTGCQDKLPLIQASHEAVTTSNLYPTPHTVLRLHWLLTPSSFSRRRLMCTSTVRESPK